MIRFGWVWGFCLWSLAAPSTIEPFASRFGGGFGEDLFDHALDEFAVLRRAEIREAR